MKRFFFSLIALSAAAAGCTQSAMLETPEALNQPVSFSPYTGRTPETKATSIIGVTGDQDGGVSLAQAGGFRVFAVANTKQEDGTVNKTVKLNNVLVEYDNGMWKYSPLLFWPDGSSSTTMSFVGYSANGIGSESGVEGLSNISKDGFTFTVPTDISKQVDLLATAYQANKSLNNNGADVTMQFHHLLTRIGFKLQTSTNKQVAINSIALKGSMYTSATLDFDDAIGNVTPVLKHSGNKNLGENGYVYLNQIKTFTQGATTKTSILENQYLMILPHTVGQNDNVRVEVEYTIGSKTKQSTVEIPAGFDFKAGYAYEFILKISTSSITFDVTEKDWNNPTDDDTPIIIQPKPQEDIILGGAVVNTDAATVSITINNKDLDVAGVAYKIKGSEDTWSEQPIDEVSEGTHPVTISGLAQNTEYVYCGYSVDNGTTVYYPAEEDNCPSFVTTVDVRKYMTDDGSENADVKIDNVIVHGSYDPSSSSDLSISEYGFCLIEGYGTPTIMDKIVDNTSGVEAETITGAPAGHIGFKYSITGLKYNTIYTFCAYVKNSKGIYSYSSPYTFQTLFVVDDEDYAGDGI